MRKLHAQQFTNPWQGMRGLKDNRPTPFPGRWPTRLVWRVDTQDAGIESYCGKPTPQATARFWRLAKSAWKLSWIVEFDRTHYPLIAWTSANGLQIHPNLFGFYHYWHAPSQSFDHLQAQTYPRRIAGYMIYSPVQRLSPDRQATWLGYAKQYGMLPKEASV